MTSYIKPGHAIIGGMAVPDGDDPRWKTIPELAAEVDGLIAESAAINAGRSSPQQTLDSEAIWRHANAPRAATPTTTAPRPSPRQTPAVARPEAGGLWPTFPPGHVLDAEAIMAKFNDAELAHVAAKHRAKDEGEGK